MRTKCKHAGRLKSGASRLRDCSHPEVGGECETAGKCQTCGKWERAGERTGETADLPPARVALQILPCEWERELTGKEREAAGLTHTPKWKWCDHPQDGRGRMGGETGLPLGKKLVCTCNGCGPNCRGYEGDQSATAT